MTLKDAVLTLLIAVIPAAVSFVLGWRKARIEPEQIRADIAAKLTEAASTLIGDLRAQIEELEERVTVLTVDLKSAELSIVALEKENAELRCENERLQRAIEALTDGRCDGA